MADNFDIKVSVDTAKAESDLDNLVKQKRKIDIDAKLDTGEIENQLKQLSNRKIQLDIEVGAKDQASKIAKDIEKGLRTTKIDASGMAKSLADSFNISDKAIIKKMQSQINNMMSNLASTWNGKNVDLTKASGFYSGIDDLGKTVAQNARIIESKLGIYDRFYDYAKNKKIFVSDDLKSALGTDEYKELLKNNVGKITKDATKGLSIDSLWGELTTLFPEHFSDTIANQADQIRKYFDVLKSARADITKMISTSDMTPQQLIGVSDDAFQHVVDMAQNIRDKLVQNLNNATEKSKTTFDLDIEVNTEKIVSDIRNAIKGASSGLDDSLNIDIKLNDEEIASQIRSAVNKIGNGDEDITVDIKVDRQSLQADINAALNDLDLPIHFNIDAAELEADIRKAVDNITDISIDLKIDADSLKKEAEDALGNIDPLESYRETIKTARQTSTNTGIFDNDYMSKLSSTAGRVFDVFVAANAYDWGGDKIRDAISDLRELNTTLVEIDKTGNLTSTQLKELGENSFDNASKWGSVVQDYLSSSETFAQAGFENLEEMSDLSTMAQVAGQMTQEVATNFLIATDAAWQMKGSAEQLTNVLDGMNMVTNKNALNMTDLANGVRVAGSMLANSGLTQGEATSLLGTGIATTKEAGETVARGVRTIIMNLREIKGETEDGEIIDESQLKKVEVLCNDLGVSLKNVKNGIVELRNPVDILRDLSKIYNSLDVKDKRRSDITDTIGGKYRSNILSAILTNFDLYDKMMQDYASGSGSMVNEAMKTADSWQGRLNSLSNQWTEFISGFMDTEYIKGSISGLEGMIVAMDKLNDAQLFIPTMLSSIMGLRNMFTGKGLTNIGFSKDGTGSLGKLDVQGSLFGIDFTKMGQWKSHFAEAESLLTQWNQSCLDGTADMKTFGGSFVSENKHFKNYISTVKDGSASLEGYKKSLASTGVQFQKFSIKSILANAATGFLVGAGIELAIAGITKLMDSVTDAQEKVENAVTSAEKYQQTKTEIQSINSELETIGSQIDQLNAKENLSLTDAQELSRLQAQSAELERQLEIKKGLAEIEQQQAARDAKKAFNAFSFRNAIDTNGEGFWTNVADGIASATGWLFDKTGLSEPLIGNSKSLGYITIESTTDTPDKILSERIFAAKTAQKKLKELQDKQTAENYDSIQPQIDKQQKVVDNYATNLQELYSEMESYTKSFYDQDTGERLEKFQNEAKRWEAVQKEYLDYFGKSASSKEGAINTLFAKKQFSWLENGFIEAAQKGRYAIRLLIDETPEISDALDEAGVSVEEFIQHFMALGNPNALNLERVKNQLQTDYSDILGENPTLEELRESDYRGLEMKKLLDSKSDEEIEVFYKYVNDGDIDLSELTLEDIEEIFIKINADTTPAEMSLDELTQSANDVVSSINSINSMLSSQGTGKSISSEIFSNDELKDYQSALEYVNGCYQLNTEKVKELTEAKVDEAIATNNTKKAIEQQNYLKNAKEIDSLRKKIEENNFVGDENAEIIQSQIDNLLEQNSAIISNCNQLDVLNASLRESIGVYQQWKDAQSAGNSGDMYDDAKTAWSQIRDIADKESDMYGRVGTVQYQASVDFLVPEEIDHSDQKAVQDYLDSIRKYMYFDDNGDVNGINMDKFFKSAVDKGLMMETEDSYEIAGQMTMQKFAEGMGMSLPLVQAIFGEIEEFMPEGDKWFDWSDEAVQSLGDLAIVASDAADALQATEQFKNMDIQIDVSDLSTTEEQISALDATIEQMNQVKATPGVDTSQIEDANAIIQYCVQQKQALNEPAVMSVDTSLVEGQIGEAISLLQQFQQAQNELEMQKTLGLDTSEAESKVSNLTSEIQALNPKVTASLGIDPASTETIASTISALTPEMMVKAGVDDKAIIGYTPDDKKAMVVYGVDHRKVDAYNPQNLDRNVTYHVITQGNVPSGGTILNSGSSNKKKSSGKSGGSGANGTAHAYGTALANGAWGAKQGGMTLVGECGQELLVHIRSGKYETIGDNGAEFIRIEPGDIIFNHLQTKELLKNGYTASRAQALVSGTAFASGNAMVTGSVPKNVTTVKNKKQTSTENTSSKSKKSTDKNTKATNKNTAATNKNTKAIEESQDWISVKLDRISKQLDEYKTLASDYYQAFANQNKMLDTAINQVKANIQTNEQAYMAYMQKANSIGLDAGYKQRVMNGEINIETITDENLKNLIGEFQDFYEKAQDCREAIIDLKSQIVELSTQKIDNILDDYDTFLGVADAIYGRFEANNKLLDAQGKSASEYNLQMMLGQRNNQVIYSRGELQDLINLSNSLVQSGAIKQWSQEWYDLQGKIHDVYTQIYEAETEIYELRQQIREVRWEPFQKAIEQIDAVNDNLENTLSLISDLEAFGKDSDALNINGKVQLGLLTSQLGNARQAVAEYQNAFKALGNELANDYITQEQYNEQLKELKDGRWDAISSVKKYRDSILSLVKDGINKETDAMQKLVDTRKKDLQAQKDAADYARTLRDKTTEINKIKAQIAALQGDDSATTKAQLRNLQNQLKEAEQDLQDTQDDHAFDILQDGYDNAMEKFEEIQENELYLLNSSLEAQNEAIANMLMVARDDYQEIYAELNEIAEVYGMKLSSDVVNPWANATEAVNAYKQAVEELSAKQQIDTSKIENVSGKTDYVRYAENNSSAPDNNVQQQYQAQQAQQAQQPSVSGKISNVSETLRYGSKGNNVKLLQTALNALGFNCGAVDGSFGDQTLAAVKRFQKSVGMAGDGIVGNNTKAHFRARGYATGSPSTEKGLALFDEEGLGSEVIITNKGALRQFDAGETVFNAEQAKYLYDTSKFAVMHNVPNVQTPSFVSDLVKRDTAVHIDIEKLLNVEGNLTDEIIPKVERMINTAIKDFDRETRKNIFNNYRKVGGRLY